MAKRRTFLDAYGLEPSNREHLLVNLPLEWEFEIPEDRYEVPKWFDRKNLVGFSVKGYALVRGKSVRAEFFTEWNGKQ